MKLELEWRRRLKLKCSKTQYVRIKTKPSTINTTFVKAKGEENTLTRSNPREKGVSRERSSQNIFLESKRERENVKSDSKMPNYYLIYDKSARAKNTTLERQEQKAWSARAQ